jgi:molybdopterin-guanine dinucleotide biosynthesis protein MobB
LTVSTIKHTHHDLDFDQPGKDSFLHRESGAHEVILATPRRFMLQHDYRDPAEASLSALLTRLSPVDLVLAEGFREENHPKLLVYRAASGKPLPDPARIPGLLAVVTDQPIDGPFPVLDIDDAASVITFALHALNLTGQPTA